MTDASTENEFEVFCDMPKGGGTALMAYFSQTYGEVLFCEFLDMLVAKARFTSRESLEKDAVELEAMDFPRLAKLVSKAAKRTPTKAEQAERRRKQPI
jgi:hypothetical protein